VTEPSAPGPARGARRGRTGERRLLRALLVLALVAFSFLPIVSPTSDDPAPADAVIVLSGDHGDRFPVAMALIERGLVGTLVFVGTHDRPQEDELCSSRQRVEFICLRPQPDSTRAEARAVADLAERRGWRTIVVVTSNQHLARSRMVFRRCFHGTVRMTGGHPRLDRMVLAREIPKEWLKATYTATLARGC